MSWQKTKVNVQWIHKKERMIGENKMAVTVARVHTHTHTQGNLVNNKKESMISALLNMHITEQI